jgi:RNA-directed DNA polymerase
MNKVRMVKLAHDFLGHHIQQYPAGKHRSSLNLQREILGFNTLITPNKKSSKAHQEEIGRIIKKHRSSPQSALIRHLNPVIRGWTSFYTNSDAKTVGELSKQDYLTYLKLRRWAKFRCGNINAGHKRYWHTIGGDNWVFSTRKEGANPLWLLKHSKFACSSNDYVKVKGDKSPYDGDLVYWSSRMGKNPDLPSRISILLKWQKGKCSHCEFTFRNEDVMEVDHIVPRAIGGKDEYKNLQLLHRHCHDVKTKTDLELIRKHNLELVSSGKKPQASRKKGKPSNDKSTPE